MDARRSPAPPGSGDRLVTDLEILTLAVLGGLLVAGLTLTALASTAWPVPVAAMIGLAVVSCRLIKRALRTADEDVHVSAQAAAGVQEIETWLAHRHSA